MAFISEHDYNEEMVKEVIIDNVLEEQFDLVAYIRDHTYQIVVKNPTAKDLPALDSGDFNDYLDEIIGPMVEDREILKALSPETVLCELATHKEHEAVVVLNGEEVSYKEFSFYLIDENSKFFLLLIKDITKEHQEQAQLNDRLHHALAESKRATEAKGLTVIPLDAYFNDKGRVKLTIGLCRGKNVHDKRESLKAEIDRRETDRVLKNARK